MSFCFVFQRVCTENAQHNKGYNNCERETWCQSLDQPGSVGEALAPSQWLLCWDQNCSLWNLALERTSCLYFDILQGTEGGSGRRWQCAQKSHLENWQDFNFFHYENLANCCVSLWTAFPPTLLLLLLQSQFIQSVMNDFQLLCKLLLSRLHCNQRSLAVSIINPGFQVFIITWQFSNLG